MGSTPGECCKCIFSLKSILGVQNFTGCFILASECETTFGNSRVPENLEKEALHTHSENQRSAYACSPAAVSLSSTELCKLTCDVYDAVREGEHVTELSSKMKAYSPLCWECTHVRRELENGYSPPEPANHGNAAVSHVRCQALDNTVNGRTERQKRCSSVRSRSCEVCETRHLRHGGLPLGTWPLATNKFQRDVRKDLDHAVGPTEDLQRKQQQRRTPPVDPNPQEREAIAPFVCASSTVNQSSSSLNAGQRPPPRGHPLPQAVHQQQSDIVPTQRDTEQGGRTDTLQLCVECSPPREATMVLGKTPPVGTCNAVSALQRGPPSLMQEEGLTEDLDMDSAPCFTAENRSLRALFRDTEAQLRQRKRELGVQGQDHWVREALNASEEQVIAKLNSRLTETLLKLREAEERAECIQMQHESKIKALEASVRRAPVCIDRETQTVPPMSSWYPFKEFSELHSEAVAALSHDITLRLSELKQEKNDKTSEFSRLLDEKALQVGSLSAEMAASFERHVTEKKNLLARLATQNLQLRAQKESIRRLTLSLEASNVASEEALKVRDQLVEKQRQSKVDLHRKVRYLEQQLRVRSEQLKETVKSLDVLQRSVRAASLRSPPSALSTEAASVDSDAPAPLLEIPDEFLRIHASPRHTTSPGRSNNTRRLTLEGETRASGTWSGECMRAAGSDGGNELNPQTLSLSERICSLTAALLAKAHAFSVVETRASDLQNDVCDLRARVHQLSAMHEHEERNCRDRAKETVLRERVQFLERHVEVLKHENHTVAEKLRQLELAEAKLQDECEILRQERLKWIHRLDMVHQDHIARSARERKQHETLLEALKHHVDRLNASAFASERKETARVHGGDSPPDPDQSHISGFRGIVRGESASTTLAEDDGLPGDEPPLVEAIQELTEVARLIAASVTMVEAPKGAVDNPQTQGAPRGAAASPEDTLEPASRSVNVKIPWPPSSGPRESLTSWTEGCPTLGPCSDSNHTGDLREMSSSAEVAAAVGPVIHQLCELFLSVGRRLFIAERRASFSQFLGTLCYKQWQLQSSREAEGVRDRNLLRQQLQALQI
ncbi:hypothetical protein BESB_061180 [Besnoitia besnoiti]|uniref:Uncharacterized protein n=1 Tax=Besnoitia besnoiti TaxID=94643 RepID=A0A2A9MG28_BESBE|nr:hypothetical protein BESB_061180 [Besnoitia besnoiti]PFH35231.1 hypothetical protein BESB_061180 [Besnoitia besnoiti]